MNNKTIGVVLATYNGEKYIEQQLKSIVEQSCKPSKIVISDGGSSDNTTIIAERVLKSSKIKYKILISEQRLSVKENFQKGLENIETDYIFFSDQDDFWLREKIAITISYMEKNNAVLAFSNAKLVDKRLIGSEKRSLWKKIKYYPLGTTVYSKGDDKFVYELLRHNVVTGMCACITKELKKKVLPFSEYSIHDSWIAINAINHGTVVAIDEKLVLYRQHDSNAIGAGNFNLSKTIKKSKSYLKNVESRKNFVNEWIEKNNVKNDIVCEYVRFLLFRIGLINGKYNLGKLLLAIPKYFKFEVRPFSIIIKDVYSKLKY